MQRFIIFLILVAVLGATVYDSVISVPDGYAGIASIRLRRLSPVLGSPRTLEPGLHLSLPFFTRLQLYSTRVQMLYIDVPVENQKIFRLTAQVRLDSDSAAAVHARLGPGYLQEIMKPTLRAIMEKQIYLGGGNMTLSESQQQLLDAVGRTLAIDGLVLDQAVLTRLEHLDLTETQEAQTDEVESDTDEDQD